MTAGDLLAFWLVLSWFKLNAGRTTFFLQFVTPRTYVSLGARLHKNSCAMKVALDSHNVHQDIWNEAYSLDLPAKHLDSPEGKHKGSTDGLGS